MNVLLKCDAKDTQRAGPTTEAFLKSLAGLESIRVLADGEVAPLVGEEADRRPPS
ncbi:hypothetical protein ACLK1W_22400 [Escherichia coli]